MRFILTLIIIYISHFFCHGQIESYLFLNVSDCFKCQISINLNIDKFINAKTKLVFLSDINKVDSMFIYSEIDKLSQLERVSRREIMFTLPELTEFFIVNNNKVIKDVDITQYQQIAKYLESITYTNLHGNELIKECNLSHDISVVSYNSTSLIVDHLVNKMYLIKKEDSGIMYPLHLPPIDSLYFWTKSYSAYRNYLKLTKGPKKLNGLKLKLNDLNEVNGTFYLSCTIPDISLIDTNYVVGEMGIILTLSNEGELLNLLKYSSMGDEDFHGYYPDIYTVKHIEGTQYFIPVYKEDNFNTKDCYLGIFNMDSISHTLKLNSIVNRPFPSDFSSIIYQYNFTNIVSSKNYYSFIYYPKVFRFSDKSIISFGEANTLPIDEKSKKVLAIDENGDYLIVCFFDGSDYRVLILENGRVLRNIYLFEVGVNAVYIFNDKIIYISSENSLKSINLLL